MSRAVGSSADQKKFHPSLLLVLPARQAACKEDGGEDEAMPLPGSLAVGLQLRRD